MRHHSPPEVLDVINLSIPWRNLFPHAFTDAFSIPLLTQKRMAEKKNPPLTGIEKKQIKFMLNTCTVYIPSYTIEVFATNNLEYTFSEQKENARYTPKEKRT